MLSRPQLAALLDQIGPRSGCGCRLAVSCCTAASCPRPSPPCPRRAPPPWPCAPWRRPRPPALAWRCAPPRSSLARCRRWAEAAEYPLRVLVDPAHVRLVDPIVDGRVLLRRAVPLGLQVHEDPVARQQVGAPPGILAAARLAPVHGASPSRIISFSKASHAKSKLSGVTPVRPCSCLSSSMTMSLGTDRQIRAASCLVAAPAASRAAGASRRRTWGAQSRTSCPCPPTLRGDIMPQVNFSSPRAQQELTVYAYLLIRNFVSYA